MVHQSFQNELIGNYGMPGNNIKGHCCLYIVPYLIFDWQSINVESYKPKPALVVSEGKGHFSFIQIRQSRTGTREWAERY